ELMAEYDPAETVLAGDVLHSFSGLPTGVTQTIRRLKEIARDAGSRLVVTPGNHDTMLSELWDGPQTAEHRLETDIVVTHGHVPPTVDDAEWFVVGHDHPTIEIEGVRRPCFLYARDQYRGAGVLMLPTFSRLPAGVAVNGMSAADFDSPLVTDAGALRPIVRDESAGETHRFPPLEEFRRLL
ncbi:MAG: metallophosphoesterase, partial [Natronomonas sp.]